LLDSNGGAAPRTGSHEPPEAEHPRNMRHEFFWLEARDLAR
jgi:hypothetical protein